jgi:hypothetical protein
VEDPGFMEYPGADCPPNLPLNPDLPTMIWVAAMSVGVGTLGNHEA